MNRTPVTSTNILSIGYDPQTMTLEVEFRDGAIYQYFDVPEHVYEGFLNAASHGAYLAREIKGRFRYARV